MKTKHTRNRRKTMHSSETEAYLGKKRREDGEGGSFTHLEGINSLSPAFLTPSHPYLPVRIWLKQCWKTLLEVRIELFWMSLLRRTFGLKNHSKQYNLKQSKYFFPERFKFFFLNLFVKSSTNPKL